MSAATTAILCPGQGSHQPDMRDDVAQARPDLLALACELVGEDPFERVDDGTAFAQPAMYCASLAGWEVKGKPAAEWAAGHSLGELAALAIAGAFRDEDGLRLAVARGRLMGAAAKDREGGMLALLGDGAAARTLAGEHGLTMANENAPDQLVVAGKAEALEAVRKQARSVGLRALRLPIRGAFHSPEMEPAMDGFVRALDDVPMSAPRMRVISCASACEFTDPARELVHALVSPVRWRSTMLALRASGVESFVETGPGSVLTKLAARNLDGAELVSA